MQRNILALGVLLLLAPLAWAQEAPEAASSQAGADVSAQALAVYEQGKRLYDAKDYAGALGWFDQAAALEPGKARWQYNRGLALRKLNRFDEARDALLHARTLDPAYKQAEIDGKLREMGFDEAGQESRSSSFPSLEFVILGCIFIAGGILLFVVYRVFKATSSLRQHRPRGLEAPMPQKDLLRYEARLEKSAGKLIQVEHALRLNEDDDLRAVLNQATMAEQRAREALARVQPGGLWLPEAEVEVQNAQESAEAARQWAQRLFGEKAFLPEGERVGCYFCARPLANATFRKGVPLKRGTDVTNVLACPPCANMASAGQPPPVKVLRRGGKTVHWSELGGYDPYTHRHRAYPDMIQVPAWQYTPERSLEEVAALAAGGVLATGLAAYGVSKLLDLDGASEAAAAQAAAQEAAVRASERSEDRDWRDHS
ncbi:Tetratricopeptide repeat-containing protein [Stigmatella aurantiaca]|uniref:Tetratricopeptide repeat-containing protein n=1 Tax=Stigmatella aurantiaca TaxID=41 RepID=A0A1H7SVI0_STIAU|nr:tetratricopeptide repeat protein [Stigmatella aurantiaca]SEL76591.1 Tetratricopeptide repeat-containing protein [Stigmatella aurantiaca]